MDKKILALSLLICSNILGMNDDAFRSSEKSRQQTTLADDIQEGDFCSGLTSYNGELGYYLLRLDDEEGLKHVRKLSLDELIYFNGWTHTLPKTEGEFYEFIQDVEKDDQSNTYSRYTAELVFHCVNNEKQLLKEKIKYGQYFALLIKKNSNFEHISFTGDIFMHRIKKMYASLIHEIEENSYDMSYTDFQGLVDGINCISQAIYNDTKIRYTAACPYYIF